MKETTHNQSCVLFQCFESKIGHDLSLISTNFNRDILNIIEQYHCGLKYDKYRTTDHFFDRFVFILQGLQSVSSLKIGLTVKSFRSHGLLPDNMEVLRKKAQHTCTLMPNMSYPLSLRCNARFNSNHVSVASFSIDLF